MPSLHPFLQVVLLLSWLMLASDGYAQNPANLRSPLGMNVREWSYWQTELAPVDFFKRAGNGRNPAGIWLTQAPGTWDTGEQAVLDLDPSGWPRSLPSGGPTTYRYVTTILVRDTDKFPGGRWTVFYDGDGSLAYGGDAVRNAAVSAPGRDVFDVTTPRTGFTLSIMTTDPNRTGNYLRNIRVIPPGGTCNNDPFTHAADASACPATYKPLTETYPTQPFHPLFLADMRPFSALRFIHFANIITTQISSWADRSHLSDASYSLDKGVPWEVALDMANVLNASPWLEIPARASDDYITQFARLAKARYTGSRPIYLEYYNEVWNGNYPYGVNGSWVEEQANARWPTTATPQSGFTKRINWFALRTRQICGIWKREFADQPGRVKCVMGAQSGNAWVARQALACPLYAAEPGGSPCNGSAGIDAIAIAPYFGSYISNPVFQPTVETWLNQPDGGLGKLFEEINTGILPRSIAPGSGTPVSGLSQILSAMRLNKVEADAGGVRLVTYEGGQEMGPSTSNAYQTRLQTLFAQANRDPRMGAVYKNMLDGWRAAGGELNMLFQSTGAYSASRGNSPYKEWQGQPVGQAPKYSAATDFIAANPCWWADCATPIATLSASNSTIYNIPSPSNIDQPFLRIYNPSASSGQVRGTLYDQNGGVLGSSNNVLLASLAANSVTALTAADIATAAGVTTWAGRAWLKLEADFAGVKAMNLIRSSLLLSMSCLETDKAYYIPSPSATNEQAYIRLYNPNDGAASVSGTLYDENGNILGTANAVLVPALAGHAVSVLDASTLAGLVGATSWTGRAWLSLSSGIAGLRVMNTLRDLTTNTLTNASCSVESSGTSADVLNIPSPTSATTATLRIYNTSSSTMTVSGTAYGESGTIVGASATLGTIPAKGVLVLSNTALASLIGASSWSGRAWLRVTSNVTGLKVLAMTRQQSLMEMSCAETTYAFNIPDASNAQDRPFIRIYNTGATAGSVSGTLYDQSGNILGSANSLLVANMAAHSVSEFSASLLAGAVGAPSWSGRAWLKLSTPLTGIKVLNILEDQASGNRANMSCATN